MALIFRSTMLSLMPLSLARCSSIWVMWRASESRASAATWVMAWVPSSCGLASARLICANVAWTDWAIFARDSESWLNTW